MRDGNITLPQCLDNSLARLNEGWPECGMETTSNVKVKEDKTMSE